MTHLRLVAVVLLAGSLAAVVGCDEEENREAGETAGEAVSDAVEAVGEGTREAADAVGDAMEEGGRDLQEAADDDQDDGEVVEP